MSRGYIPRKDADFDAWFHNLVKYVERKTGGGSPAWPDIPAAAVAKLRAAYEDWIANYRQTFHPHSSVVTLAKNEARKRAEDIIRPFVRRYLHFEPVTNEDRANMGIPVHGKGSTQRFDVHEFIEILLRLRGIREILVLFKVKGSLSKAKPPHYDGAEIVWAILDSAPVGHADLILHSIASRSPHVIEFDETQRGKTVYIAARWVNGRGHTGPWSDILHTIIP